MLFKTFLQEFKPLHEEFLSSFPKTFPPKIPKQSQQKKNPLTPIKQSKSHEKQTRNQLDQATSFNFNRGKNPQFHVNNNTHELMKQETEKKNSRTIHSKLSINPFRRLPIHPQSLYESYIIQQRPTGESRNDFFHSLRILSLCVNECCFIVFVRINTRTKK